MTNHTPAALLEAEDFNQTQRCENTGCPNPRLTARDGDRLHHWRLCLRCYSLKAAHKMSLQDLVELWEAQGQVCFACGKELPDPRTPGISDWRGVAHLDHDHVVCPQKNHSCPDCRRGWACPFCNQQGILRRRKQQLTVAAA